MERFIYKKAAGITVLSASFADFRYKKHSHREYAMGVTLRGIQQYNLNGILQSSYRDGVMLFNPEQPHDGMSQDRSGIDYVMLYIRPELFLEIIEKKEIVGFTSPIVYDNGLEQRILRLSNAVLYKRDEALCSELLLSLSDCLVGTKLCMNYGKDSVLIRKAKDMIHDNLDKVLRLEDICNELGISKFQFIRSFKAGTGISPYQYFLNCKVELAKQLIEKNRDIYSAVEKYGFVDLTHLNKNFKSMYGITAYEYMKHLNNGRI